ncbi:conserved protein of unknown function [Methylacidimicrobium sp. AP8]|uniref:SH3 domain-containing protein n=1 Tax=Methylacidimicrobium sp. AP8 TaxID=2730359 RepID=UPI0018C11722|nr:SH3 domain-containing protein [Methylacidimicrobium sp. AP8]CAB4243436.1 conserved protein of unknown function [Methylacidimicrobium sp. AP8]
MNASPACSPPRLPFLSPLVFILAFALSFPGCASLSGGYDLVTKNDTPLYYQGPGQEVPDTYLEKGTRVRIVQSTGAYARVETTRGIRGFVRMSDLQRGPEQAGMGAYGGSSMGSAGMF